MQSHDNDSIGNLVMTNIVHIQCSFLAEFCAKKGPHSKCRKISFVLTGCQTKTSQFENLDTLLNDMHSEDMHTSIGI